MKVYGHQDVRIMNGGRKKWLAEARELGNKTPAIPRPATMPGQPTCRSARSCPRFRRR